jgi:hypothetical protein
VPEINVDGLKIRSDIRDFINEGYYDEAYFEKLFVDLALFQYTRNEVYKKYVDSVGGPDKIFEGWRQVPALPVSLFKEWDSIGEVRSFKHHSDERVWHSSGTTGSKVSKTFLANTRIYDDVIKTLWLKHNRGSSEEHPLHTIRMIPDGITWPNSSLAHFFDIGEKAEATSWDGGVEIATWNRFSLNFGRIISILDHSMEDGIPIRLLGTSYAIVQLFEFMEEKKLAFRLPGGSSIIDTGGYKGIVKDRTRREFLLQAQLLLDIPHYLCKNEYGMSEMTSHFWSGSERVGLAPDDYESTLEEWWEVPPWVRVRMVSPFTMKDDPNGVAAFYDLANVWSVCALLTEDLGIVRTEKDGQQWFRPLGRLKGAEDKGCSIGAERAMS